MEHNRFQRLLLAFAAMRQIGPRPLALFALYRLGLSTGHYRRTMPVGESNQLAERHLSVAWDRFSLPSRSTLATALGECAGSLLAEADEIAAGNVRLFGADPVPLCLALPGPLEHWTAYQAGSQGRPGKTLAQPAAWVPAGAAADAKFVWEPGRLGWAYTLGRAYRLSGEERYAAVFWTCIETFLDANPPNLGPHWSSAQEVALRLIALAFTGQVFAGSAHTTPARAGRLAEAIARHAARLPPTLVYARSQNNNHLLTEAAGLITAGVFLPSHPSAARWRALGWRWLHSGLEAQIGPDGAYIQNSANYHRLLLQIALWGNRLAQVEGRPFPERALQRLAAAVRWLLSLVDPSTGQVPNLGPNDGACIFPLAGCPFADYRPAVQAAGQAFLGERPFPPGPWDEMALWFDPGRASEKTPAPNPPAPLHHTPHILRSPSGRSWAYFRIARHAARPGHADQLHLDLWWRGLNIAQDAGTYLYNGAPPWDNSLAGSSVHNTVTVDDREPMRRAGRFLWLDWAQAQALSRERAGDGSWERLLARQDGYRRLNVLHQRQVTVSRDERWLVEDQLSQCRPSTRNPAHAVRLHWLLPDWPWEISASGASSIEIRLASPSGWITIRIQTGSNKALPSPVPPLAAQIVRSGELLHGSGPVSPTWGWVSPTYGQKIAALSLAVSLTGPLPLTLSSEWLFPEEMP